MRMQTRPTFFALVLALAFLPQLACDDDPPDTCDGPLAARSVPLFAPCGDPKFGEPDPCEAGICVNGFCSEPCAEDDDCQTWDGIAGRCDQAEGACWYPCQPAAGSTAAADATCPVIGDLTLECGRFICEATVPCPS
ncbi:hypothetical protein [Nannocystis pusilla]|uniref:Lipoprotein n=1 Tax=Nannocystis pusilla TaxID=889268 RepID=A0ABS7U4Q8_9BACT|nr:hypothetical protein [Nannocystis pusilla]MBZ5715261.1 hypothetical protein [Nannocystis pusilla]